MRVKLVLLLLCLFPLTAVAGPVINVPASYNLGNQRVGVASAPLDVVVQNDGDANLNITATAWSGTNAADFATVTGLPLVVPAGSTRLLQVTFKPGAVGARAGTLTLASNDTAKPMAKVNFFGTGVVAGFMLSPSSLTFARQRTAGCTVGQLVQVSNPGSDALRITALTFEGAAADSFRTGTTPLDVPAGGVRYIDVKFCPRGIGTLSATLSIATDFMAGHKATVALTGTGFGPVLSVAPAKLDFGAIYAGMTSAAQTVTIRNTGDDVTTIAGVVLTGQDPGFFSANVPMPNAAIAAGASITIDVVAKPTDTAPRAAELVITVTEDLIPNKEARIPLSATGILSSVTFMPATVDCGSRFIGTMGPCKTALVIRNTGTAKLEGLVVVPSTAEFRIDNVPTSLMPGESGQGAVSFRPLLGGARSGLLSVRAKGLVGKNDVTVTGTGQNVGLSLSPSTLDFGSAELASGPVTRVLALLNEGAAALDLELAFDPLPNPAEIAMNYAIEPTMLTLAAGELQQITVRFTPQTVGDNGGQLQILHSTSKAVISTVDVTAVAYPAPPPKDMGCSVRRAPAPVVGPGPLALLVVGLGALRMLRRKQRAIRPRG